MSFSRGLAFDSLQDLTDDGAEGGSVFLTTGPVARVHVLSNEFEAHVLVAALEAERIDAVVQPYRDMAFDGLFQLQRGWGCILTRVEDSQRAVEVIREALKSLPAPPREEE